MEGIKLVYWLIVLYVLWTLFNDNKSNFTDLTDTSGDGKINIFNQISTNSGTTCDKFTGNYITYNTIESSFDDDLNRSVYLENDVNQSTGNYLDGYLNISYDQNSGTCSFETNHVPNHNVGYTSLTNESSDYKVNFAEEIGESVKTYKIPQNPQKASIITPLNIDINTGIMLNGAKMDTIAAACYGVKDDEYVTESYPGLGKERVGCNNMTAKWRYDPLSPLNGFEADIHNAHVQPGGLYHYHASPNAIYMNSESDVTLINGVAIPNNPTEQSPIVGFAADGFPIYGPIIFDGNNYRKVKSSYQLRTGSRPSEKTIDGQLQPGFTNTAEFSLTGYDGRFVDDYVYVEKSGDLDECNGAEINERPYGYYLTTTYPWSVGCFKGTPDASFYKKNSMSNPPPSGNDATTQNEITQNETNGYDKYGNTIDGTINSNTIDDNTIDGTINSNTIDDNTIDDNTIDGTINSNTIDGVGNSNTIDGVGNSNTIDGVGNSNTIDGVGNSGVHNGNNFLWIIIIVVAIIFIIGGVGYMVKQRGNNTNKTGQETYGSYTTTMELPGMEF